MRLDPRTELLILIIANLIAFINYTTQIEMITLGLLALLLTACGCGKTAVKWIIAFIVLVNVQYYLIPVMPKMLAVMFMIFTVYLRRIFPCIITGSLIIKTTPVRYMIIALNKWHVPQKIIIPLSITLRYFPAVKEEYRHIKDAMKLRNIKGFTRKLECTIVPILVSATGTADELSAAAITRGIENPGEKTCITDLRFHASDYICLLVAFSLFAYALITL